MLNMLELDKSLLLLQKVLFQFPTKLQILEKYTTELFKVQKAEQRNYDIMESYVPAKQDV